MSDEAAPAPQGRWLVYVLLYTVARLVLVAALTGALVGAARLVGVTQFPLVVAILLAVVVALPLGMVLFAPLRRRATAGLAEVDRRRREERAALQDRLRGDGLS